MVDLPGVGDVAPIIAAYCLAKCSAEAGHRQISGGGDDKKTEAQRFAICLSHCMSPVDLPVDTTGGTKQPADDDDDD